MVKYIIFESAVIKYLRPRSVLVFSFRRTIENVPIIGGIDNLEQTVNVMFSEVGKFHADTRGE